MVAGKTLEPFAPAYFGASRFKFSYPARTGSRQQMLRMGGQDWSKTSNVI
jgi:hypothetical protein